MSNDLIFQEQQERAKFYLESALKFLGIAQIAISIADMFWDGTTKITIFNSLIFITGLIFFLGAESLKTPLFILLKKEKREEEQLKYKSERNFEPSFEKTMEYYREKEKKEFEKRYDFLRNKNGN